MVRNEATAPLALSCIKVSSTSGIAANAALISVFVDRSVGIAGRELMSRDVDVAKTERAVLTAADEMQPTQAVDNGHRVSETVQGASPQNGIFVNQRIYLRPVGLSHFDATFNVSENAEAVSPQCRGPEAGKHAQILALAKRLERFVTNVHPFGRVSRFR